MAGKPRTILPACDAGIGTNAMKLLKKLGNPMVLVAQGFALGAFFFFATHPETGRDIAERTFASAEMPAAGERIL
jgi:hypothetical protein